MAGQVLFSQSFLPVLDALPVLVEHLERLVFLERRGEAGAWLRRIRPHAAEMHGVL